MRKHVVTILMLCLAAMPLAAQQWTSEQLAQANTARDASYLSEQEKQVVFLCNLARMDGALFLPPTWRNIRPTTRRIGTSLRCTAICKLSKTGNCSTPTNGCMPRRPTTLPTWDAPDVPATQAPTEPTLPTVCMAVWVKKRSLPKTARTATTTMWR